MGKGKRQQPPQKRLCCSKKIVVVSYAVTGVLTATLVLGVFLDLVLLSCKLLLTVLG